MKLTRDLKTALYLGSMCVVSYLGCYFARSLLSVVTPEMTVQGSIFNVENIGIMSTAYMIFYALGQLVNGRVGDMFRAKWLVGLGLFFSGVSNLLLPLFDDILLITVIYSISGIFQSMIYAPLMRVIAENTLPHYANRCCLGFSVASFLGTPVASLVAVLFNWKLAFVVCGITLMVLGVACYVFFDRFEHVGVIKYRILQKGEKQKTDIPRLIRRGIVKFTIVSILTGIVRTSVLFWIPTYLSDYLGFSAALAAAIVSVITVIKSTSPYVGILIFFERIFRRSMSRMLIAMFLISAIGFGAMFLTSNPFLNVIFLTVAMLTSGCASSMVFSVWCPSLADTGMVSTATGFVDAASYLGAAIANLVFAGAVSLIGWGNIILIWAGLMAVGVVSVIPYKKNNAE